MNIFIKDLQKDLPLKHEEQKLKKMVSALLKFLKKDFNEVSITFVSAPLMKKLHKEFFDDGSLTDCISQPMDSQDEEGYRVLGEIFVCPKAAIKYAKEHQTDPYQETTLYVIHGLLHLLGYDDIQEKDIRKMRKQEQRLLDFLQNKRLLLKPKSV